MSKSLFRTLLLGGVLAAAAVPAVGFAAGGGPGAHGARHGGHFAHKLMAVADEIGLTDAQKARIKAIFEANKPKAQALRTEMRETLTALDKAIDGGADNDTIAELAIEAHSIRAETKELKQKVRKEVGAVLTPEQKAKLKEMRQARRGGEGKRGGPGKGKGGFGGEL